MTEYCKTYGENYCLGQLIYWHNQANADPDRVLVRASRGCLSLPDISSFYAKAQKPSKQRVYGPRTVRFMLARMVSNLTTFHYFNATKGDFRGQMYAIPLLVMTKRLFLIDLW